MGEATKSMILYADKVSGVARDAQEAIGDALSALTDAAVEVSKRNEMLLEKLEDSNEKYAGLLAVQTAVLERNWAAAYNLAGQTGVNEQHLLRDLRWALERVLEAARPDSGVAARAHIIAGRFSIPLMISMEESLSTVEDFVDAFEDETDPPETLAEALGGLHGEGAEPGIESLSAAIVEELDKDGEFHQTFRAAMDAALARLGERGKAEWEKAISKARPQ